MLSARQRRSRAPAREPLALPGHGTEARREDLQRDDAAEPRVARAVDLPHPARAERRLDLVRPETRARRLHRLTPFDGRAS
jgi:hypothetical protein